MARRGVKRKDNDDANANNKNTYESVLPITVNSIPSLLLTFIVIIIFLIMAETTDGLQAATTTKIHIGKLLSTCVDACTRGCDEIRKVQSARESNDNRLVQKVQMKDELDPRSALTEADGKAQKAIVDSLRKEWGGDLRIVGEEDDPDADPEAAKKEEEKETAVEASSSSSEECEQQPLRRDLLPKEFVGVDDDDEEKMVELSSVTIFVDPLDGTREFVEGRLENCQSLVGITVNGKAVGGIAGIPFFDGNKNHETVVYYGLVGTGTGSYLSAVGGATAAKTISRRVRYGDEKTHPKPHHATGDSSAEVMSACREKVVEKFGGSVVTYGGAGNKLLAAALGEIDSVICHKVGGAWDVCAPQAILVAAGGTITDLFGNDLNDDENGKYSLYNGERGLGAPYDSNRNEWGYVATSPKHSSESFHDDLVKALAGLPAVESYKNKVQSANKKMKVEK